MKLLNNVTFLFFGWFGFGFRRSFLFGNRKKYPVATLDLGFIKLQSVEGGIGLIRTTLEGLADDPEWLAKNHRLMQQAVEEEKNERAERAERAAESLRIRLNAESDRVVKLNTENHALRRAIEIVQEPPK